MLFLMPCYNLLGSSRNIGDGLGFLLRSSGSSSLTRKERWQVGVYGADDLSVWLKDTRKGKRKGRLGKLCSGVEATPASKTTVT
jgi:hypothetical protein